MRNQVRTVPFLAGVLFGREVRPPLDFAGNISEQSRQLRIDSTAPKPPQELTVVGGEGFRRANRFTLHWSNPPQTGTGLLPGRVDSSGRVGL